MFKRIFTSEPVQYQHATQAEIDAVAGGGFAYNPYLVTAPRVYNEEINWLSSMFIIREQTLMSDYKIVVQAVMEQTAWPSWGTRSWTWNSVTGEFLGEGQRISVPFGVTGQSVTQSWDGSLWTASYTGSSISEVDYQTGDTLQTLALSFLFPDGGHTLYYARPLVSKANDLILVNDGETVYVIKLSTGEPIRDIKTGTERIINMCAEDEGHIYVLGVNSVLQLIDFTTGKILSTLRAPLDNLTWGGNSSVQFAYDRTLRRLLFVQRTPEATDGASTTVITGYYPVPLATQLTAPIPLTAPRKYRTTPMLMRVIGDAGEPISGVRVQATIAGEDAVTVGASQVTDNSGYSITKVLGVSASDQTNEFLDTFTDTNGTLIEDHTPDTAPTGFAYWTEPAAVITGNKLTATNIGNWVYATSADYVVTDFTFPYVVSFTASITGTTDTIAFTRYDWANGAQVQVNLAYNTGIFQATVFVFNGTDAQVYANATVSSGEHVISVLVEATQFTLSVDGVAGTPVAYACPSHFNDLFASMYGSTTASISSVSYGERCIITATAEVQS